MSPPRYDLSQIQEKFTLWMGQYENLNSRKDIDNLVGQMTNTEVEVIYIAGWGHTGIMFSKSAEPLLRIINKMKSEVKQFEESHKK